MNGKGYVSTAFSFELCDQASSVRNDDGFVPLVDSIFAHLERSALDAAGVELWEDLDDFHGDIRD